MIDMIVKDKKEYFKQADYIAKQKKREQEEREKVYAVGSLAIPQELAAQRAAALNPSCILMMNCRAISIQLLNSPRCLLLMLYVFCSGDD